MSKLLETISRFFRDFSKGPLLMDKIISQAEIITINNVRYVRKRYSKEIGILKWLPPALFLRPIYPFTLEPKERLKRELVFFSCDWDYFKVPKVLEYSEERLELIREYVEGDAINYRSLDDVKLLAKVLAEIHSSGYSLGDVKPTNFLKDQNSNLYVIDAEQAVKSDDLDPKSWDIVATLMLSSYAYITNINKFKESLRAFLKEYLDSYRNDRILLNIMSQKFSGLTLLIPLPHLVAIIEVLENVI